MAWILLSQDLNAFGAKPHGERCITMDISSRLPAATILLVEDEVLVRLELANWLEELGLVVLEASDADEALSLLNINPQVDLLLTDIKMPGSMDGIGLGHHLRRRWPLIKIIVLSAMIDTPQADLPANSLFVPKPYDHQKLWGALSYLTSGDPPRTPHGSAARA
jgi:CheY-like chemotaxis protein